MQNQNLPPAIFLMGPTASGKTELAEAIYREFPVDLISVDAAQVYRGMDIGTAKPSASALARVPHRLIDIRDPREPYSAADFCRDARQEMEVISQAGRIPLLVGGTMFYFHSLEYGLSTLPKAEPALREQLTKQAEQEGWPALHARLARADPVMGQRLDANDAQRIQRALEILELTGQPPSQVMRQSQGTPLPYRLIKLALVPADRQVLYEHIAVRFQQMLDQGLVAEMETLLKRGDLDPHLPAMRMVGYRQVRDYLDGKTGYSDMVEQAIVATRRLAKRQLTWLRSYEGVTRFDSLDVQFKTACFTYLRSKLGYT